jgi:hypothetical protein
MSNDEQRPYANPTDLNAACEEVFQLHKRHIIVNWSSHTDLDIDSAIQALAINKLEGQKIIFKPNPLDCSITQINPIVTSASSYRAALSIIEEKGKPAPIKLTPIINDGARVHVLEPPGKKKSKALWIIIAIIIILFLLFNFVPFYKWL